MNMAPAASYTLILWLSVAFTTGFMLWRVSRWRRRKHIERRLFPLFWAWPLMVYLHGQLIPAWQVNPLLFQASILLIWLTLSLDFFYYFVIKAGVRWRLQLISALPAGVLAASILVAWFRPIPKQALVLPHYGVNTVWSDHWLSPKTLYFMVPPGQGESPDDDPNFAKAVFSPMEGQMEALAPGGFLLISRQSPKPLTLKIGPFLPDSIRPEPGSPVKANQVLGLLAETDAIPGIQLHLVAGEWPPFGAYFSGKLLPRRYQSGFPRRNRWVVSASKTRFRFQK